MQKTWLPQMLWYCQLVADPEALSSAFSQDGADIWTSVTGYDELVEQVLDDGDIQETLDQLQASELPTSLRRTLRAFILSFQDFDNEVGPDAAEADISSSGWKEVQATAREVVEAARAEGLRLPTLREQRLA